MFLDVGVLKKRIERVPESDEHFIECLKDKLWRLNNIYHVKNKQGQIVPFKLNPLQFKVVSCLHNRLIVLKSRQVGISTLKLLDSLDSALFEPNMTIGVMAQGLDEASELLEKARLAWNMLHVSIKRFLGAVYASSGLDMITDVSPVYEGPVLSLFVDNSTEYGFTNGSKLMVRTSFRSGTLQMLHVSELGKIAAKDPKKAYELKTGTFQAIGDERRVTVESTAEGRSGYFYELWKGASDQALMGREFSCLDFYPIFIGWTEDPDCVLRTPKEITPEMAEYFEKIEAELGVVLTDHQKWFYVSKKLELAEHITQEYPSTPEEAFQATRDGFVYGEQMRILRSSGRIVKGLYDENLPVFCSMDLGMRDLFVLVFWQVWDGQNRIVGEYVNRDKGIEHYVNVMYNTGYKYARIFGPHDLAKKDIMYAEGQNRAAILRDYGVPVEILPASSVEDGIQAVKLMLKDTLIDESCVYLIECLDNYTRAWDDVLGHWRKEPVHNKFSHGADALRYMAVSGAVAFSSLQIFHSDGKRSLISNNRRQNEIRGRFDI